MDDAQRPQAEPAERYVERHVKDKGLRPRFAAALIASVWLVAIFVFGVLEHLVDPDTFDNVWLGMWWATQTVTTVGYGDTVPSETAGQVIAVVLMVAGLSLFAVVTGTITSLFVARAQAESQAGSDEGVGSKLDHLTAELERVREQVTRLEGRHGAPPDSGSI